MKPLVVLLIVFALSCLGFYITGRDAHYIVSGRIAMAIMLLFTAVGHFAFYKGMAMTVPPYVPFKNFVVYFTGVLEVVAALGLILIGTHYYAAFLLIVFLVML